MPMRNRKSPKIKWQVEGFKFGVVITCITLVTALVSYVLFKPRIISPIGNVIIRNVYAKEVYTPFATVLIDATKEFSSEGPAVLHDMYNVLWCEHRYNQFGTPHKNDNNTKDFGPFQINSFWRHTFGTKFETDLDENIRVAHEIWKRSKSFEAWTCVSKYHVTGE